MNEEEFDDTLSDPRALWRSVVAQAITDALSIRSDVEADYDRRAARAWFLGNSADFREVCEMAELDPKHVRASIIKTIEGSEASPQEPKKQRSKRQTGQSISVANPVGLTDGRSRNGKKAFLFEYKGEKKPIAEWAKHFNVKRATLYHRIWRGQTLEEAIVGATKLAATKAKMKEETRKFSRH